MFSLPLFLSLSLCGAGSSHASHSSPVSKAHLSLGVGPCEVLARRGYFVLMPSGGGEGGGASSSFRERGSTVYCHLLALGVMLHRDTGLRGGADGDQIWGSSVTCSESSRGASGHGFNLLSRAGIMIKSIKNNCSNSCS